MGTLTLNITECPSNMICGDGYIDTVSTSTSGYSKISAGMLELSMGTLGDYVIEWRLNAIDGELLFVSGNLGNTDVDIQRYHDPAVPGFEDEVVPGGEIYAVIRYVTIDGVRYDGYYSMGVNYSPDLLECLGSITIQSLTCENGGAGTYSHSLSYSFVSPIGSSTRTIKFIYPNDGSEAYLAFNFFGYEVVDLVNIYAVKEGASTTITQQIGAAVGSDNPNSGLITSGSLYVAGEERYNIKYSEYSYIINLTGVECDYLNIEVTSSAIDVTNTATNWRLDIKCLDTWDCDTYIVNPGYSSITTSNMAVTWDSVNCQYVFTVTSDEALNINTQYNNYATWSYALRSEANTSDLQTYRGYLENRDEGSLGWVNLNSACYELDGTVTIERNKTLERLRISFTHYNDFIHYKTSYEDVINNANISNYSTTNTDINFHKYVELFEEFKLLNCNQDADTRQYFRFHPSSHVVFNNVPGDYYMDIFTHSNLTDPTNTYLPHYPLTTGVVDTNCSTVYEIASSAVSSANSLYNMASTTTPYTQKFTTVEPFRGRYLITGHTSTSEIHSYCYYDVHKEVIDEVCPSFSSSMYSSNAIDGTSVFFGNAYKFYHHNLYLELTGTLADGASIGDYKVYQVGYTAQGTPDTNNKTLIKEVIGGIVQ